MCARPVTWPDKNVTKADCPTCGWAVSKRFSYCPWCHTELYEEGISSEKPMKAPKGFRRDARCDAGCGGGVEYPMRYCPWCGKPQHWNEDHIFEGNCPHCARGVDDAMESCPWCGKDATGRDLIERTLRRVRRLLRVSRIREWDARILLRPGVSGVDPRWPNTVEIEQAYVVGKRTLAEVNWRMLVGLVLHELGHSFLYQNWEWTHSARFKRTFGEVKKAYRVRDDLWVDFQRRHVAKTPVNFVSTYASTHPQEDFAETFRFYVTRRGRLRQLFAEFGHKRKGAVVYEKFLLLHDLVSELRGMPFSELTR
jgi:hypothetical protein